MRRSIRVLQDQPFEGSGAVTALAAVTLALALAAGFRLVFGGGRSNC